MEEIKNKNSLPVLSSLIKLVKDVHLLIDGSNYEKINYLKKENELTCNLNADELKDMIDALGNYPFARSLSDDINSFKTFNQEMERLFYLLYILFNKKLVPRRDEEAPIVFKAKTNFFIIEDFEIKLRSIYLCLLEKHIENSPKDEVNYIAYLTKLKNNINIKYYGIKIDSTVEILQVDDLTKSAMHNEYLDALIMGVIAKLLAITDEELEDENMYAFAISYQLLLRSLFVIMNDNERLMMYNSIYQGMLKTTMISHNIIKMAFISYHEDLKAYQGRKKVD